MSAADRASAADLSCSGAVCLHCQFVPYGTWCAYVAHLSCPGAVCLHRQFVPYGTWCAYVAHLSCPGRGAHTPPICHVRGAMCIRRPFVMFERGAPAPPICHVRDAMCIRRPFVMFGRGAPAPPICYVRGAMRLHRRFVMSGARCACTADLSCSDAMRLRVEVRRDAFAQISCARRMIQFGYAKPRSHRSQSHWHGTRFTHARRARTSCLYQHRAAAEPGPPPQPTPDDAAQRCGRRVCASVPRDTAFLRPCGPPRLTCRTALRRHASL